MTESSFHILIVDDNHDLADNLRDILMETGWGGLMTLMCSGASRYTCNGTA
jgi:CheY-like chemotaxis protein